MAGRDGRSRDLFRRAQQILPGGVSSPVRAMGSIGRDPIFIDHGEGAEVVDVDGRRYIDYVCSWGPLVAGHAHPDVVRAAASAVRRGSTFGAPTEVELRLAAEVIDRVPGAEMVRMTSSGTEATMAAIRLARAVTGREKVVKFAGAYHGHVDGLLVAGGSGMATLGVPASPGVPLSWAESTIVVPWNDAAALNQAIERHGGEIAAILAEPIPANMGVVAPADGLIASLQAAAHGCGALLVLDEVISGFRVARGGAQELYGIDGDLTVLGKIIGGGFPVGAVAGPRTLMERLAPSGDVYHAGTLSGNPVAMAAGLATLELLDGEAYRSLARATSTLAAGIADAAEAAGAPVQVVRECGLVTVFFSPGEVRNYEDAARCDVAAYGAFCRRLLELGIYPPASQFEAWFPSLAHSEGQIARTVETATRAFTEVVRLGYGGGGGSR